MDVKEIEQLKKLAALFDSANAGERTNAIDAAGALLKRHGKTMVDLPGILGQGASAPAPGSSVAAEMWRGMWETESRLRAESNQRYESAKKREQHWQDIAFEYGDKVAQAERQTREREAKEKQAKAAAKQAERDRLKAKKEQADRKRSKERGDVIKRYGSEAAVLAPCEREKLLKAAIRQWSKFYTAGMPEWTTSIARCRDFGTVLWHKKKLTHVIDAIAAAYPLPETIEGAIAEKAYWDRRVREMVLVRDDRWGYYAAGDLTIQIRQHVLQGVIDTMPAKSVQDVLARMRGRDMTLELQKAVIADLKTLSSATETVVSHEEFRAARQKRETPVSKAKQPKQRQATAGQTTFEF